jgi:hypothetical protein
MSKQINESINFLLAEYNRLKLKEKNNTISKEEKESLHKIASFIGKSDE